MELILRRQSFSSQGIFGTLESSDGFFECITLERAYETEDGFKPKVPAGLYVCKRGSHQLKGQAQPFETFEITNVPEHFGILFHVGNYNLDSLGCVLVGDGIVTLNGIQMIVRSKMTFAKFMHYMRDVDEFQIHIVDADTAQKD